MLAISAARGRNHVIKKDDVRNNRAIPPAGLRDIWDSLCVNGYALTDEDSIGLPQKFRENFGPTYFNDHVLRHDRGDWPADRKRARDVVEYRWRDGEPELEEFGTITITDRAGIPGQRDHARVRMLDDPLGRDLVRALLAMVPPASRQAEGTFGINLFRTYTNVVSAPHHDNEEFIIAYVVSRTGGGAETYLYRADEVPDGCDPTGAPVLRHRLDPGEIIIFRDSAFKHGATPLTPAPGESAMRDALICTVDYEDTYLTRRSA